MKYTILLIAILCFLKPELKAQTYYTGFDDSMQQFGWNQFEKGDPQGFYNWELTINGFSNPNCLAHYYPVGGTIPTDNWYVSPEFNFENGATIDSLQYSFSGFGTPMPGDTIGIYLLSGNQDPDSATNRTLIQLYYGANYVSEFNIWKRDSNIVIPENSGSSFIALRYKTIVNWLDVKFDNINIRINEPPTALNKLYRQNQLTLFPNPSNAVLNIEMDSKEAIGDNEITIVNATGLIVYSARQRNALHQVELSDLEKGLYFCIMSNGKKTIVKSFIKD